MTPAAPARRPLGRRILDVTLLPAIAIGLALIFGAVLMILSSPLIRGFDLFLPITAYKALLEGSVGSFFAAYEKEWIDFPKLTGTETLPLWAAMSEMYAEKAAESMAKFKFIGFVGPTATRDQSVFNKIEQPTFVEVITVRKRVPPPSIEWFVVDCEKDDKGNWVWTKKAPEKFSDRSAALARITQRYGG